MSSPEDGCILLVRNLYWPRTEHADSSYPQKGRVREDLQLSGRAVLPRLFEPPGRAALSKAAEPAPTGGGRAVAETGVDYISVGALTKNVTAIDLSMRIVTSPD